MHRSIVLALDATPPDGSAVPASLDPPGEGGAAFPAEGAVARDSASFGSGCAARSGERAVAERSQAAPRSTSASRIRIPRAP